MVQMSDQRLKLLLLLLSLPELVDGRLPPHIQELNAVVHDVVRGLVPLPVCAAHLAALDFQFSQLVKLKELAELQSARSLVPSKRLEALDEGVRTVRLVWPKLLSDLTREKSTRVPLGAGCNVIGVQRHRHQRLGLKER